MENKGYNSLIQKIDAFIKKYYRNRMVKGVLLFLLFGVVTFLSVTLLEHFGRFNSSVRMVLFFGGILLSLFLLFRYILIPLSKLFRIGSLINHEQASKIIGRHFPNVDDKLLNTLQLRREYNSNSKSELLLASIEQRSGELSVVPFSSAIQIGENKKYLWWLLPILFVVGAIVLYQPKVLSGSTERLVNYSKEYVPEAPFQFQLNNSLDVVEGEDLDLKLQLTGSDFPSKLYVISDEGTFLMDQNSKSEFSFVLKNIQESSEVRFKGNGFYSEGFNLNVLKKPEISSINIDLVYPTYLNRKPESITNAGDVTIPEGTLVKWNISSRQADEVKLILSDTTFSKANQISNLTSFSTKLKSSDAYKVLLSRADNAIVDSSDYLITVIKDKHPEIQVTEEVDSTSNMLRLFSGVASDDYGLTGVSFVARVKRNDSTFSIRQSVNVNKKFNKSPFFHHVDLKQLNLNPDDEVSYYFIVRDNDKPNGFKTSRSRTFVYQVSNEFEIAEKNNQEKEEIENKLEDVIRKANDFNKKINDLKRKSLESQNFDWKDLNQMNELINEQQSLEQEMLELNQEIQKNQEEQSQFNEQNEELLQKQEEINELMEKIMDDEMKELLEKLKEMMENQDKKSFDEEMKNLEIDSEDMNEKLENSLELLKRLEVEEKNDQISKNLEKLAEEQKKLSEEVKDKEISNSEALEKQKEIDKKFEQIQEDVKRLMEKNEGLKNPMKLSRDSELEQQVNEEMQESEESLEKNKSQKASDSQKKASEKMQEMSENMQQQMQQQMQEQTGEDMQAIRMLLENIVSLSLDQEYVMESFQGLSKRNPKYVTLGQEQHRVNRDTKIVEDSLKALASRVPQIASILDKELKEIKQFETVSIEEFALRNTAKMNVAQQKVMTSFNNLALILNESLEQMQKQAQNQMPGSGQCSKPGGKGSKPSSGMSMKQMKQMLKQQLEQMKKGNSPNGKKPGNKPGQKPGQKPGDQPGFGMGSKEISKMARQQSALRRELKKLAQKLNSDGSGKGNGLNKIAQDLEKLEKDLVNKKFNPDMIRRQKEIYTRLLESEKAMREQEFDNKRKSKSGENKNNSNLILLEQYKKRKLKEIELLKSVPPSLNEYYKNKANEYINHINK